MLTNSDESRAMEREIAIPFAFSQVIDGLAKDSVVDLDVAVVSREFVKDGFDVSVKVDLQVRSISYSVQSIGIIDDIRESDEGEANPYSMVIYFVKPGDSLWKIAKRYRSTVSEIVRINGVQDEGKIQVGEKLFIPKVVMRCEC